MGDQQCQIFLTNISSQLRSPTFSVLLPCKDNEYASKWYLKINQSSGSQCYGGRFGTQNRSALTFSIALLEDEDQSHSADQSVWISDCAFYILDSMTGGIKYTARVPTNREGVIEVTTFSSG